MANTYLAEDETSFNLYLKEISRFKPLKRQEEYKLIVRAKRGDQRAMQALIQANLRFVVSVASNYRNQGMPMADLVNEGNMGLIRAAKRFDETRGFKFISYAVWWIRQAILQAMSEQSRIMRLPLNRVSAIHNIGKVVGKLEQTLKRYPTSEEIANYLKIEETEVREALSMGGGHDSLDAPFGGDGGTLLDLISTETGPAPDEKLEGYFLNNEISGLLESLKAREAEVLKLYYGIDYERSHTLEEIAGKFGLTRERIRQVKERAIKRLKHPSRNSSLRKFYAT